MFGPVDVRAAQPPTGITLARAERWPDFSLPLTAEIVSPFAGEFANVRIHHADRKSFLNFTACSPMPPEQNNREGKGPFTAPHLLTTGLQPHQPELSEPAGETPSAEALVGRHRLGDVVLALAGGLLLTCLMLGLFWLIAKIITRFQ